MYLGIPIDNSSSLLLILVISLSVEVRKFFFIKIIGHTFSLIALLIYVTEFFYRVRERADFRNRSDIEILLIMDRRESSDSGGNIISAINLIIY